MEEISKKINSLFLDLFKTKKYGKYVHPFLIDLERIIYFKKKSLYIFSGMKKTNKLIKDESTAPESNINLIVDELLNSSKFVQFNNKINDSFFKTESFDESKFQDILEAVNNGENINVIKKLVHNASRMRIPSNVKNNDESYFENYFPSEKYRFYENKEVINNFFEDKKLINIAIIGSGPVGLFLALYLNFYYNNYSLNNQPNVRIIIYENRVENFNNKTFKKPFTRERPFATGSGYLASIFNKIFCLSDTNFTKDSILVNINVLEYILFSKVYLDNIPLIFKEQDESQLYRSLEKLNIDVMFDCTGGRLETNYCLNNICLPEVPKWLTNESFKQIPKQLVDIFKKEYNFSKNDVYEMVQTIPSENKVIFNRNEKFIKNYYYSSLTVYDSKNFEWIEKEDIFIENEKDLKLFTKLRKLFFRHYDLENLSKVTTNKNEKNKIIRIYNKYKNKSTRYIFYIDLWHTYMRHTLEASKIIGENKKILKINAGDTLFHSHFLVGSGLNRTLNFGVKCVSMLTML